MTRRERVIAALSHRQPDKTPYQIDIPQDVRKNVIAYCGDDSFASGLENCIHPFYCGPANEEVQISPRIMQDYFGVQWDKGADGSSLTVANNAVTPENIGSYNFPDPEEFLVSGETVERARQNKEKFVLWSLSFALFERAWTLAGMEELLMAMILDKDFVHKLLDKILEYNLKVIEKVCSHDVIDGAIFGDDWGHQTGLIMGRDLWREFIKPRMRRMYDLVKSKGKFVLTHSCGKTDEVFPDLIECGVDAFNPFQPEVVDVFEIKRRYGRKLAFYGGVGVQGLLPHGSAEEVRTYMRRLIKEVGKDGGLIVTTSQQILGDARPENVLAMIDALKEQ